MRKRWAACDHDLVRAMLQMTEPGKRVTLQVEQLAQATEIYMCECEVPAQWFLLEVEEEKPQDELAERRKGR